MAFDFTLSSSTLPSGRTAYYAKITGSAEARFIIGYRTKYLDDFGLFNTSTTPGLVFKSEDYEARFGFWAWFILPTVMAESKGSFYCLNTYDRAKFTFTFMQYAAHVPNGDFVVYLRKLLQLPKAADYFPRLALHEGRICYKADGGALTPLENNSSTQPLMDYLNPTLRDVERQELISAARFVHWATNDPAHRALQVETAVDHFKKNMQEYHNRFNLHGSPAKVCLMVADIRHQGRAKNDRIALALNTGGNYEKAYQNLLLIGNTHYADRIRTLRTTITQLLNAGKYQKKYNAQTNEFDNL